MATNYDITGEALADGLLRTVNVLLKGSAEATGIFVQGLSLVGSASADGSLIEGYGDEDTSASGYMVLNHAKVLVGSANADGIITPSSTLNGSATASGTLTIAESATLVASACYALNLDTKRTYRLTGCDFRGMGRFNGKVLAAGSGDIVDIETAATTDNGTAITSYLQFDTDFGVENNCSVRDLYCDESALDATLTSKEGNVFHVRIPEGEKVSLPRQAISKTWTIKLQNKAGKSATIRRLTGEVYPAGQKGA